MTEPKTFPIEDGAFTVPRGDSDAGLLPEIHVRYGGHVLRIEADVARAGRDAFVHVAPADIPAFIASLDALTGGVYRRSVLEEAAREVDCGCFNKAAALTAKTKPDRWRACGEASCGALMAQDIRALADKG